MHFDFQYFRPFFKTNIRCLFFHLLDVITWHGKQHPCSLLASARHVEACANHKNALHETAPDFSHTPPWDLSTACIWVVMFLYLPVVCVFHTGCSSLGTGRVHVLLYCIHSGNKATKFGSGDGKSLWLWDFVARRWQTHPVLYLSFALVLNGVWYSAPEWLMTSKSLTCRCENQMMTTGRILEIMQQLEICVGPSAHLIVCISPPLPKAHHWRKYTTTPILFSRPGNKQELTVSVKLFKYSQQVLFWEQILISALAFSFDLSYSCVLRCNNDSATTGHHTFSSYSACNGASHKQLPTNNSNSPIF